MSDSAMTKTDRTALQRILKRRFEMLQGDLQQRRKEIEHKVSDQVKQEHADTCKRFEKEALSHITKIEKIFEDWRDLVRRAGEAGVEPSVGLRDICARRRERDELAFVPLNLYGEVQKRVRELLLQAGAISVDLNETT